MQVLDRGEKIELLVDKTENLHNQVCVISFPFGPHKCVNMSWMYGHFPLAELSSQLMKLDLMFRKVYRS